MNKVKFLALATMMGFALAGCSTQQTSQQSQVAQTAPQSQGLVAASPVMAKTTKIAKPLAKPRVIAVRPKSRVAAKPRVAVARPSAAAPKVVMVKARPAVKKRPAVKPRVIPAAPKIRTVKKPVPTPASKQTPWQRRQAAMGRMQTWNMGGRAALRFKGEAWTFGLNWIQKNRQQYSLQIRNPLTGTVVGILDQSPGKATLRSRGKVSTGTDAERLLQQQLRVKMPVNGMPYWIRGVMAPQYPVGKVVLDAKGRPKQIVQAGWVMDYFNYQGLGFDALPRKVNISRKQEQVNVRILAKQWKTR